MRSMTERRRARIEQVLRHRQKDLTLVLANIHDPHNVSAIYRSCDAFGVASVHLYYTTCAFPALSKKTSASARKWVDTVRHDDRESLFAALRARPCQVLATSCTPSARPVGDYDFTKPTAIIMGNEHAGVPEELIPHADGEVYLAVCGLIQSLRVPVAADLLLAEGSRQRREAGMYERMSWTNEEYAERLALWLEK